MANRLPTLPQPPIVWGPSETDAWIRGSFPSGSRGFKGPKVARRIRRLAVKVWSDSVPSVRGGVISALETLGYRPKSEERLPLVFAKGERTIQVRLRSSILGDAITVVADFSPPAPYSTPRGMARTLAEEFPLGDVKMTDAPIGKAAAPRFGRGSAKR